MPHWDVPGSLFDLDVPDGFRYERDFITTAEEAALASEIARIEFATFEMRGVIARRRVAFFGMSYGTGGGAAAAPFPPFLLPLRDKVASWADLPADAFAMALVNEYSPGAPIGWHRDAPQYGIVVGISLLASCRMKFRPYLRSGEQAASRRTTTHEVELEPRSAYLLTGPSRTAYEHHIPPAPALRYSVTFRTLRASSRKVAR